MNSRQKNFYLLIILLVLFVSINYNFLDKFLTEKLISQNLVIVDRVIDGDTVQANETRYRLLGINAPEKGEKFSSEATDFLTGLVLNRSLKVEEYGEDLYGRKLAYFFIGSQNVNLLMVENGLANVYILENKIYEKEFFDSWEKCLDKNLNLCEKSLDICANCLVVEELSSKEDFVILKNVCSYNCDLNGWEIKDEGRKKFVFEDFILEQKSNIRIFVSEDCIGEGLCWKRGDYVWTDSGDTLFLRDAGGRLVLFYIY